MSALLSLICPQCIVSSLSPVSLSVVSFHWPGPRYTWGIGPHCTLGAGVTLSLSRESDSDTQRVTWECVNCEYFVWIMNFDKGLAVSVMQIQNINLEYQTGAVSLTINPLYRGMPRICDWHYQRYLRRQIFRCDPAKSSKVMSFSAASLDTRGYIRAINWTGRSNKAG